MPTTLLVDTQGHPLPVLNCVYKKIKDHHDDDDDIYIPMMMICEMLPTNPITTGDDAPPGWPLSQERYLVCPRTIPVEDVF